jgi:hypothetical protein
LPEVQELRLAQAKKKKGGEAMKVKLSNIELDASIQCRSSINTETVNEYAESMTAGVKFPCVELFGTANACLIGDGWHRVLAARQIGAVDIDANMHKGGRGDALKFALSANASNGLRRTNADKRRCVEIALKEWPKLSSRAVAELCGVHHTFVEHQRPEQVATVATSRTGTDGKQYPARKEPTETETTKKEDAKPESKPETKREIGPPCAGMMLAEVAVRKLEEIQENDEERNQAFEYVKGWIIDHEAKT